MQKKNGLLDNIGYFIALSAFTHNLYDHWQRRNHWSPPLALTWMLIRAFSLGHNILLSTQILTNIRKLPQFLWANGLNHVSAILFCYLFEQTYTDDAQNVNEAMYKGTASVLLLNSVRLLPYLKCAYRLRSGYCRPPVSEKQNPITPMNNSIFTMEMFVKMNCCSNIEDLNALQKWLSQQQKTEGICKCEHCQQTFSPEQVQTILDFNTEKKPNSNPLLPQIRQ